jgi:pimeloyl-ACP methyl ester carboxylesterase
MIAALLLALGCFLTAYLFSAFTFSLFWYEAANTPYGETLKRLAGGNIGRLLLKGVLWGVFSQGAVLFFLPCAFFRRMWNPPPDLKSTLPTVILLHGVFHNRSAWVVYRRRLRRAGFTNIYAWNFPMARRPFEELVGEFAAWLERVAAPLPGRPVVLIGHSLGGLIARAYAQGPQAAPALASIITLGTPHQGSKLAALGPRVSCSEELLYRGPAIERLERGVLERASRNDGIDRLAIYSPIDNMVLPPAALKVPLPGWTHRETSPISHVAMLYHGPTIAIVMDHLAATFPKGSDQNACQHTGNC